MINRLNKMFGKANVANKHLPVRAYTNPRNGMSRVNACPACGTLEDYLVEGGACKMTDLNPVANMKWVEVTPKNLVQSPQ